MEKLSLFGGTKTFSGKLPVTNNIGKEEETAAMRVLRSGNLSGFLARAGEPFLGGPEVRALERVYCRKFGTKHAVSFNSATTALDAAVVGIGIGPGDEVIVSPFTMAASATAILMNNAIPVFADIDRETFCLDPASVEKRITKHTKALMVTNLYGGSARYDELRTLAQKHDLRIIEDNAQAAGAMYHGKLLGTIGDAGVFSLNVHKQIQTGEGGVLITSDDKVAFRAQLRRNHGETVLDELGDNDECSLGSNFRMTELVAAIAQEQLKKLDMLNSERILLADHLSEGLRRFPFLRRMQVLPDSTHVYYLYPIIFDAKKAGFTRKQFVAAMEAEGFSLGEGYIKPLYLMPLFQNKRAYPGSHCPFDCPRYKGKVSYDRGICPVAEELYEKTLLTTNICRYPVKKSHIDLFLSAIDKVAYNGPELSASK
jgi:perosamine synthetase